MLNIDVDIWGISLNQSSGKADIYGVLINIFKMSIFKLLEIVGSIKDTRHNAHSQQSLKNRYNSNKPLDFKFS